MDQMTIVCFPKNMSLMVTLSIWQADNPSCLLCQMTHILINLS